MSWAALLQAERRAEAERERHATLLAALDALVAQVERDRPVQHVADWMWLDELKAILRQYREGDDGVKQEGIRYGS